MNPSEIVDILLEKKWEPWIGVDLDQTLANGPMDADGGIGEPNLVMALRVHSWLQAGKKVKIMTARAADQKQVPKVKEWLKDNGFPDLEVTNEKDPGMEELWDDKARQVVPDSGLEPGQIAAIEVVGGLLGEAIPQSTVLAYSAAHVDRAAAKTDPDPSPEQAEAGNYRKGKIRLHGLEIAIENRKGGYRKGIDKDGKAWKVKMPAHYGDVKRTEGKDGDPVDVWIGPNPESELVWIINQQDPKTKAFDEHKVMLGFTDKKKAIETYDKAYEGGLGPRLRQSVGATSIEGFKEWLKHGSQNKPFSNA